MKGIFNERPLAANRFLDPELCDSADWRDAVGEGPESDADGAPSPEARRRGLVLPKE